MEASLTTIFEYLFHYVLDSSAWVLVGHAFFLYLVYLSLSGVYQLEVNRVTGRYQKARSVHRPGERKILLLGDSTAVGTGARSNENTLVGFLAHDFPLTTIINKGVNGALTGSIYGQLESVAQDQFDMVIISTGGNDVWAFTRLSKLRTNLHRVLKKAKQVGNHRVILLFFGNEGSAPFFPFFLRPFIMQRTEKVRQVFMNVATLEEVPLIELFSNPRDNPFVQDPKRFFAPDGLHPGDEGYWAWYKHLWSLMVKQGYRYHEEITLTK